MSDNSNVWASWALSCLAAASCAGPGSMNQVEDLGMAAIQFDDIPVPDGLRLKTSAHESHSYEVDGFRFGDFEYYGVMRAEKAVSYMRDRMAVHGWALRDSSVGETAADLVFWRRPYETKCRIWQDASITRMKVAVRTKVEDGAPSHE